MKIHRLVIILVVVVILVCVIDWRSSMVSTTESASVAVERLLARSVVPTDSIDLGDDRYIKYTEKDGKVYAGVVFPERVFRNRGESRQPGLYLEIAKMLLQQYDDRRWVNEKKEERKDGCWVYVFRLMTEDEI